MSVGVLKVLLDGVRLCRRRGLDRGEVGVRVSPRRDAVVEYTVSFNKKWNESPAGSPDAHAVVGGQAGWKQRIPQCLRQHAALPLVPRFHEVIYSP